MIDLPVGLDEEPDRVSTLLSLIVKAMRKSETRWQDAITADLEVMGVYSFSVFDTHWTHAAAYPHPAVRSAGR